MTLKNRPFENIVGKGENAGNQNFLLFQQYYLPFPKHISIFQLNLFCHLQMLSIWTSPKILLFGKVLIKSETMSKHKEFMIFQTAINTVI